MTFRMLASSIVILGGLAAATPAAAAVVPCVAGQAGPYPCRGVDQMGFLPHSTWGGGSGNDVWGWTDAQTGHEYAIVGTSKGTAFVDVTVPDTPVYMGFLFAPSPLTDNRHEEGPPHDKETPRCGPGDEEGMRHGSCAGDSQWRDIEVYADHAYIGSEQGGHGLVVFDLRELRNVTTPPVTFTNTFRYMGVGQSHTITVNPQAGIVFINGSRSATACAPGPANTGGPVMLSAVANPSVPVFVGCNLVDGYTHDSQCTTYTGPSASHVGREICFNSNEDTLTIVDVTDKQAPVMLSRFAYPGEGYTHQGWLTEDQRYFLLDDELDENNFQHNTKTYIFDLANLGAPQLIGTHFGPTQAIDHNQYIVGRYSYQSNYRAGLRILHTGRAGLGQLREVAFFDVFPQDNNRGFAGTWANYPFFASGNVVVTTMESSGGLFVVRPRRANLHLEVAPLVPGVFRLTVTNQGPDAVESADVSLSGGSVRSVQPSQGSCTRRPTTTCTVGALANGASATVDVALSPFGFGPIVRAEVQGVGALDGSPQDDAVDIVPALGWR